MINIRKITEDNFKDIIGMKRRPEEHYVAANAIGNKRAKHFYEKLAFKPTGENTTDEVSHAF